MKIKSLRKIIFWCLVLLLCGTCFFSKVAFQEEPLLFESFEGEIVMYHETENGTKLFLKDSSLGRYGYREFLITGETEWLGTEFEEKIKNKEVGIQVVVESKFKLKELENDPYGTYPVFRITPVYREKDNNERNPFEQ